MPFNIRYKNERRYKNKQDGFCTTDYKTSGYVKIHS